MHTYIHTYIHIYIGYNKPINNICKQDEIEMLGENVNENNSTL